MRPVHRGWEASALPYLATRSPVEAGPGATSAGVDGPTAEYRDHECVLRSFGVVVTGGSEIFYNLPHLLVGSREVLFPKPWGSPKILPFEDPHRNGGY